MGQLVQLSCLRLFNAPTMACDVSRVLVLRVWRTTVVSNIRTSLVALSFCVTLASEPISCFAADSLPVLKSAYDHDDYVIVVRMGREITQLRPESALVHYYVANSLVQLSQPAEAIAEYQKCVAIDKSGAIGQNSAQAIANLRRRPARPAAVVDKPSVSKPVVAHPVVTKPVVSVADLQMQIGLKRLRDVATREERLPLTDMTTKSVKFKARAICLTKS